MSLGFFPSVKNEARRVIQRLYIGIGFSIRHEEMGILILFKLTLDGFVPFLPMVSDQISPRSCLNEWSFQNKQNEYL